MRRTALALSGITLIATAGVAAHASTPPSQNLTTPTTAGQTATLSWTGTIGAGSANPTSLCSDLDTTTDNHAVTLTVPPGVSGSYAFSITWTPSTGQAVTNDEVLEVVDAKGASLGKSDTSATTEEVTLPNLASGTYTVKACGYVNGQSQPYSGKLVATSGGSSGAAAAGAPAAAAASSFETGDLGFSDGTVVDPVLFGGEPDLNIDNSAPHGDRSFVSWPVSSRQNIGVFFRSEDGGLSYQKRYNDVATDATGPACQGRQVLMCAAGGGGDTDVVVDPATGHLNFSSQEVLVNEAMGVSTDHGDTIPATQTAAITEFTTGVDREWNSLYKNSKTHFLGYHVPVAGYYLLRNDNNGDPTAWKNTVTGQPAINVTTPGPVAIRGVTQSGSMVIDNGSGPFGDQMFAQKSERAIYVGFLSASGLTGGTSTPVACAPTTGGFAVGVSLDGGKTFQCRPIPGAENARSFTVLNLDQDGNLYAVWTDRLNQVSYLSTSKVGVGANATAPGTTWSKPVAMSAKPLTVTIFPNVVAGSPGRMAAGFYGTTADASTPDTVKPGQGGWFAYAVTSDNALCQWDATPCAQPTFHRGKISSKPVQNDNICTSGTTCAATMGNRNLLDMFNVDVDNDGRVSFVWSDANNATLLPYVKVARQTTGMSLYAGKPGFSDAQRSNGVADATGDARFPFGGTKARTSPNVAGLDLRGTTVGLQDPTNLLVRIKLGRTNNLGTLPAGSSANGAVESLTQLDQARYVTRFDVANPDGSGKSFYTVVTSPKGEQNLSFGAGEVAVPETFTAPAATGAFGNTYRPTAPATGINGKIVNDEIVMNVPTSALGAIKQGSRLVDVQTFSILGGADLPSSQVDARLLQAPLMVDATPSFSVTLGQQATSQVTAGLPASLLTSLKKATKPKTAPKRVTPAKGSLAATGLPAGLAVTGVVLLGLAAAGGRRRRTTG